MRASSTLLVLASFGVFASTAHAETIRSHKTGATAEVGSAHAGNFQAYINDLESRGARIRFMGGIRRGHCSSGSQHPCGKALDVCQYGRGVVDRRCHLPPRRELARIAANHSLFEGGRWCSSDYGHAQVDESADCGTSWARLARHHHHHFARGHHHRFAHQHQPQVLQEVGYVDRNAYY